MINQIIHDIIDASDLLILADHLERFILYLESSSNREEDINKLLHELDILQDFFALSDDEPYQILDDELAVNHYLYCCLSDSRHQEETVIFIKAYIDEIRSHIKNPQGARLSENDINKMMAYLEERFNFCERLFKSDQLRISLINNSFDNMNSVYRALKMGDGSIIHSVFITHEMKDFKYPQIYTLLHELGHVLHTAITREPLGIPDSFREIQELMFRKSLGDTPWQLVEIFADCFVCAASAGTELESGNPLSIIHPDDKAVLLHYFDWLMANI